MNVLRRLLRWIDTSERLRSLAETALLALMAASMVLIGVVILTHEICPK